MTISGSVRVPGDKSISHRALLLAGLARGVSRIAGVPGSLDVRATARALRRLGATVPPLRGPAIRVVGTGFFLPPPRPLDCANSGTTARLLLGALSAHPLAATLTGDGSLRRRPMRRVTDPLAAMGAAFGAERERLPITVRGGRLRGIEWTLPVASAQAKSAVLLAAAVAGVEAVVHSPAPSRDHTERILRQLGFRVRGDGRTTRFQPDGAIAPFDLTVPGDFSSAAFLVGAATLARRSELRIEGVGLNPTRTGFLEVLGRMGGAVGVEGGAEQRAEPAAEPYGDLVVRSAELRSTIVEEYEIPALIDEIPLLAVLAARAEGTTVVRGVAELRTKESDRLTLIVQNLRAIGGSAAIVAGADGEELHVTGSDAPLQGLVRAGGDHRIAMAFLVLAAVAGAGVRVDDRQCVAVSYPGFGEVLAALALRRAS